MGRPRGWTGARSQLAEAVEDLNATTLRMLLDLAADLRGEATPQQRLALATRAAIIPALAGRLWRTVHDLKATRAATREHKRRALREAVLQLPLPLAWA